MRIIVRTFVALLFASASLAFGALPQLAVTVSDAAGKAAYKGATDAKGTFATGALKPGNYVVQFNAKNSADVKGASYALFVSAGSKKVTADAVPGEKFTGGGVAMKIDVGSGLNITGQVTTGLAKMNKNGKKMVWIPKRTGSNLPAHWAEEDSAEAKTAKAAGTLSTESVQNIQAHQDQHGGGN